MANTEEKRELPPWVVIAAIAVVLVGIVLYGVHVLRGQAPNSDLQMPSSYHHGITPNTQAPAAPTTR